MGQATYAGQERRSECAQGAVLRADVENLKEYQEIQNGHIKTIRGQMWTLVMLMLTTTGTAIVALIVLLGQRA